MLQRAKKIERAIRFRPANSDSLIHNLSATLLLYAKKERMSIENAKIFINDKRKPFGLGVPKGFLCQKARN